MWNEIQNEAAIKHLMEAVDCFHDSCIKEIRYVSGAYVGDDLSMRPVNDQRQLSVIFQRQSETLSMIEIVFSGLRYLYLAPVSERYSCEIHDAAFFFKDGYVYWRDSDDGPAADGDCCDETAICAEGCRWREIRSRMGDEPYFKELDGT